MCVGRVEGEGRELPGRWGKKGKKGEKSGLLKRKKGKNLFDSKLAIRRGSVLVDDSHLRRIKALLGALLRLY